MHVDVPVTTAVLGGEVERADAHGTPLRLKVPDSRRRAARSACGPRHADRRPAGRSRRPATPPSRCRFRRSLTPEAREHYEALQDARGRTRRVERRRHEPEQVHREGPGSHRSRAQQLAERAGHPEITPGAPARRAARAARRHRAGRARQDGRRCRAALGRGARPLLARLPRAHGGAQPGPSARLRAVARRGRSARPRSSRTSSRAPSTCCSRSPPKAAARRRPTAAAAAASRRDARARRRCTAVRGSQRVTDQNPEGKYQALERYGRDLTAARPQGQARSGHRPRRGDPPRDPGAVAPHQEQPGADRRARRRQDRHRRGPGAAHRARRRARGPARTSGSSRSTWARSSPARSTAASSRSG